jgi:hypothetical protein
VRHNFWCKVEGKTPDHQKKNPYQDFAPQKLAPWDQGFWLECESFQTLDKGLGNLRSSRSKPHNHVVNLLRRESASKGQLPQILQSTL